MTCKAFCLRTNLSIFLLLPIRYKAQDAQMAQTKRSSKLTFRQEVLLGFAHFIFHELPWHCLFAHFIFSERGQLPK